MYGITKNKCLRNNFSLLKVFLTALIGFSFPICALALEDTDADSFPDTIDNCTLVANSGQQDNDYDGYGDRCDGDFNNNGIVDSSDEAFFQSVLEDPFGFYDSLLDFNSDGNIDADDELIFTDLKDLPPGPSQIGDLDGDSIYDSADNCISSWNPDQADFDTNSIGDVCDDQDGDTVFDVTDNCIFAGNIDQLDGDIDGYGNICDGDLNNDGLVDNQDENLLVSFIGTSDSNSDINGDGLVDASDQAFLVTLFGSPAGPSFHGDIDYDGVYDVDDNCLTIGNTNQMDSDDDAVGASCDSDEFFASFGTETQVNDYTDSTQQEPAIAMDKNNNYVIVWDGYGVDSLYRDIYARRYNSLGEPLGSSFKVNTGDEHYEGFASIDMDDDGNFIIVWTASGGNVAAQRYNAQGERIGSEIQISESSDSKLGTAIAMDETGGFWVVWDRGVATGYEIYARRFSSDGTAFGNEFKVNTSARGYITGIWSHGQAPAISYSPVSGYVIAWRSKDVNETRDLIYLQQYTITGETVAGEVLVDPSGSGGQGYPSIAHNKEGGFIIAWSGSGADDDSGIYARIFNEQGLPLADEFIVNTYRLDNQIKPTIAFNADGDFAIVWQSWDQIDWWDIFAQRYNSIAQPMGGEFQVNGYTGSHQKDPAIVMNDLGDFIVAWSSSGQDGSSYGIFSQHFGFDTDKDQVFNSFDNCTEVANSDQRDTNLDGYGNECDADFNNDNIVNSLDLGVFKQRFFTTDVDADFNGDGIVNSLDIGPFKQMYTKQPGPSGLAL